MIPWLRAGAPFPPVASALRRPNGLLCASAQVSAERLVEGYRLGIFPWSVAGEPVLWWSPDPRMVLVPGELRVARSLRKRLRAVARAGRPQVLLDTAFERVMRECAAARPGQDGTWITEPIVAAYTQLHRRGLAHSVEVWDEERLIGGLYGVSLGRMFYGESMFARASDASKIALAALVRVALAETVPVIDCQQASAHLASLGAREIPRRHFEDLLAQATGAPAIDWPRYASAPLNRLLSAY